MSQRKRPSEPRFGSAYAPVLDPAWLPAEFPVSSLHHEQTDAPVTHLHIHNVLEIGYCHRGEGVFVVDDKVLQFTTGCATVVTEREFHLAQSSTGQTSSWSFHHIDAISLLGSGGDWDVLQVTRLGGPGFPNVLDPNRYPDIVALVKELDAELWSDTPTKRAAVRGLLQALLAKLQRLVSTTDPDSSVDRHAAIEKVAPALAVVAGHYAESLDVADLAGACGLSVTHFRRLFQLALHQAPAEYLARFRVHKASALLVRDRTGVLDAALACGFNSLSAFSRQFAATFGLSPRAWRAKQRSYGST